MLTVFYVVAAIMIIAALAIVLMPLVRRGRQCGRPRGVFGLTLVLAFALPLSAIGVYALVGTPAAVVPSVRKAPPQMTVDQAIAKLKQRLKTSPDDLQGWLLLGQSYTVMKQPAKARDAYTQALQLAPDSADIMVAWVEADSLARPDHVIDGKARARLQKALRIDPQSQRGLWLMGISDYQAGHFVDAALTWRRLLVLLTPDSDVANAVTRQIAMANARAAGKTQAEAAALLHPKSSPSDDSTKGAAAAQIEVKVSLSPSLQARVSASDTLFVYARAASGPPMPLAIKRLKASTLPTTVTLTSAMGMAPGHNLSAAGKVILTARVSRSGQATPQTGDLEGNTGPLDIDGHTTASIVIDRML